jgi:esterase/lipase superfamily enzyme
MNGMELAAGDISNIPAEWLEEFRAAARRSLEQRMRYAFIKTYNPVLDDAPYRAFDTMSEYRAWCERELPSWPGYGRL